MTELILMDMTRMALWVTFIVSVPILTIALVVGVSIGLLQALTSVQELTLTFVPKLASVGLAFWLSMGFMSETIIALFRDEIIPLIGGG